MYNEKTIEKLKQRVLDLAIRGKLVPQDPNDEPASVLIEKIRKEKEKLIKEGKIKKPKEDSFIFKGSDNCYYENVNGKVKCIQDEIPFEIPRSWMWVRLGNIFEIGSSKRVHKSDWKKVGIPFYRARDIELLNKGIFKSELYIGQSFYDDIKNKYGVPKINDLLITAVGTIGKTLVVENNNPFYYKDGNIICLHNLYSINPYWIKIIFDSNYIYNALHTSSKGTTVDTYTIIHSNKTLIPLAPCNNQINIINKYNEIISIINVLNDEICNIKTIKEKTKLRILDVIFNKSSSYKSYYENNLNLGEILEYEQPAPYIVKNTDYNDSFDTPVLTPGKTFILGYTNEKDGIYKADKGNKVIIFDDFTTASRLVDFNFKVKSSAMKILHISDKTKFDIDYMYYLLQTINIIVDTHKRFWISEYASLKVKIHTFDEQVKIKKRIKSIFEIIDKL